MTSAPPALGARYGTPEVQLLWSVCSQKRLWEVRLRGSFQEVIWSKASFAGRKTNPGETRPPWKVRKESKPEGLKVGWPVMVAICPDAWTAVSGVEGVSLAGTAVRWTCLEEVSSLTGGVPWNPFSAPCPPHLPPRFLATMMGKLLLSHPTPQWWSQLPNPGTSNFITVSLRHLPQGWRAGPRSWRATDKSWQQVGLLSYLTIGFRVFPSSVPDSVFRMPTADGWSWRGWLFSVNVTAGWSFLPPCPQLSWVSCHVSQGDAGVTDHAFWVSIVKMATVGTVLSVWTQNERIHGTGSSQLTTNQWVIWRTHEVGYGKARGLFVTAVYFNKDWWIHTF